MRGMKTCTKCRVEKALGEFHRANRATGACAPRGGFGVESRCKECKSSERNPALKRERQAKAALLAGGLKACGKCKNAKPLSEYHKRASSADQLAFQCKECVRANCAKWRDEHPGAHQEWYASNREHKLAYWKAWRAANPGRAKAAYKAWARANPDKVNALIAKRIAQKLRAQPAWADEFLLTEPYALAKLRERVTGGRWHVDHIVPLQNKIVCGLHVPANLRVIHAFENQSKSNRYWPDMP